MHGARQRIDFSVALVDADPQAGLSQQVGEQRADRAIAQDGDVVVDARRQAARPKRILLWTSIIARAGTACASDSACPILTP
jgi:cellulose biosynthesis protein BcsQ